MRFQGTAIYCTPHEANRIGDSFKTTVFLSKDQVKQVRDYYLDKQAGNVTRVGVLTTVATALASQFVLPAVILEAFGVAGTVSGGAVLGFITGAITDSLDSRADVFDDLYGQNKTNFAMRVTYTYYRHGSNDGAYFISDIYAY